MVSREREAQISYKKESDMACKTVVRKVRKGKKPGPKTVSVGKHKRSKPKPC